MNKIQSWLLSARLHTVFLSVATTLAGCIIAWQHNTYSIIVSVLIIITAVLLQILSNIANDYGDYSRQADQHRHKAPLTQKERKFGLYCLVLAIMSLGIFLLYWVEQKHNIGFWLLWLALGALAIIAAITYTIGDKAYGYYGLGDISVFIFFGLLAVCGSFYLNSGFFVWNILWLAAALGLWCVVILNINNMRDIDIDILVNKKTLAVRLGAQKSMIYHVLLLIIALVCWSRYVLFHYPQEVAIVLIISPLFMSLKHTVKLYRAKNKELVFNQELRLFSIEILLQVVLLGLLPYLAMYLKS